MLALALVLALIQQPTGVAQQVFEVVGQVEGVDRTGRLLTITGAPGSRADLDRSRSTDLRSARTR